MSEFLNDRAAKLSPPEAVLFIMNYENGTNVNFDKVIVGPPVAKDTEGRTKVVISGTGKRGPSNYDVLEGSVDFWYRRTPLSGVGIATDGTFYDGITDKVSFLSIVARVKEVTGINCSADEFVPTPFDAASQTGYVLKAAVKSWRFEGEINIGMPRRTDLDAGLPIPPAQLPLSLFDSNNQLSSRLSTMYLNLDLTAWPNLLALLQQGYKVKTTDTALATALNSQPGRKSMNFTIGLVPNQSLNIYNATVIYNGPVRGVDPQGYAGQTGVIVLQPDAAYAAGATGNLYIYYWIGITSVLDTANYTAVMLNTMGTAQSGMGEHAFWASLPVGSLLSEATDRTSLSRAFNKAFGLPYELRYGQCMVVAYNGPVRPTDPLPGTNADLNVVEIQALEVRNSTVRGRTRVYYD